MSPARLIRWSGLSLMLGGIALAAYYLIHPPGELTHYTFYAAWIPSHWLGALAMLLILFGLVGLYARQSEKVGLLGLVAFILAFAGGTLFAGSEMFLGVIYHPLIAVQALDWLEPNALLSAAAFRLALGLISLLLLGFLLLGVATLRAAVLPRRGAWLVIVGILLGSVVVGSVLLIGTSPPQGLLQALAGVVLGLGLVVWGYALWSETGEMALLPAQPKPAPAM